jgi:RNA ligase (TIGR02306 family)
MREATIQRITKISEHTNADSLELATVLGWQVVVKKGEYKVDDLAIYVELDGLLPDKPEFEFMRARKFRVRSVRLRGEISQGLLLPIDLIGDNTITIEEGADVSEIIGVTHYEKPIPVSLAGLVRGNFPPYIRKTDEERIQNVPGLIDELQGESVYATVKCDGTSWTGLLCDGEFHVCTRNNDLKLDNNDENPYIKVARKYDVENKLRRLGINVAIQGELVGPGIQKNRLGLKELELRVFNVFYIDEQGYADYNELRSFCEVMELPMVPVIAVWDFDNTIEELLEMAEGCYEGTKNRREGIVIRPLKAIYARSLRGRRCSFKVLSNSYLLKDEE